MLKFIKLASENADIIKNKEKKVEIDWGRGGDVIQEYSYWIICGLDEQRQTKVLKEDRNI